MMALTEFRSVVDSENHRPGYRIGGVGGWRGGSRGEGETDKARDGDKHRHTLGERETETFYCEERPRDRD